eukprot:1725647-Rhodomonas_salina.1
MVPVRVAGVLCRVWPLALFNRARCANPEVTAEQARHAQSGRGFLGGTVRVRLLVSVPPIGAREGHTAPAGLPRQSTGSVLQAETARARAARRNQRRQEAP